LITVIVLGSSPLAREAYATARRLYYDARVVTCNRGLEIEPNPDFFFLSDAGACVRWSGDGKAAAKRGKTKTVTLRRDAAAMKMRTVDDFDLVVREGHPFEPFQMSGLWCLEFAIRFCGAGRVLICGCDGYRPTIGVGDYFPGATQIAESEGKGLYLTAKVIDPLTSRIVAKYPEVSFCLVGQPCYEIRSPNWEVIEPSP
jgi:hypothetical protein